MTYEESVAYFHSLLRFGVKPGLERIRSLAAMLGDVQNTLQFIHIAGTNGKGSTAIMTEALLRASGVRTGLFTSPYITDFRERIQIDGKPVEKDLLCRATELVREKIEICEAKGETITEFEAITAAALWIFARENCEIVVWETGLGGRFDATNIIPSPLVSVITSISLDHTGILGDTVEKIAYEKAGIIKPRCPVLTTDRLPGQALEVIRNISEQNQSPMTVLPAKDVAVAPMGLDGCRIQISERGRSIRLPFINPVIAGNAAMALRIAELTGHTLSAESAEKALAECCIPARCEVLCRKPAVILDGCHNPESALALRRVLDKIFPGKEVLALMGMMADKDIDAALGHLLPCFSQVITVTPSNPRSLSADELAEKIRACGGLALPAESVRQGAQTALSRLDEYPALVVCGSLYLAGDIRNILVNSVDELFEK